ncbi:hypothetical protein [Convivina intestini]|uniref:hypothetical protein n=1 Tax=Convivina intestini TaxID=1505726 RepID=UPI00200E90A8|nr:hypothetical protein [Convivina intestini]CAH1857212.1 hypothetical protein R078131_01560 [Convivina intestini]
MGAIKAVSTTAIAALLGFGMLTSVQASADNTGDLQPFTADSLQTPLQPFTADSAQATSTTTTPEQSIVKTDQGSGYTKPDSDVPFENALTTASNFFGDKKVTNNQSNGVVSSPKQYSNDVDAANDLRMITPVENMSTDFGKLNGDLKKLENTNKQTEVTNAKVAVTNLGANSKDADANQFKNAAYTHTQLSNNGTAMDQYFNSATKELSLVLNGKAVTISNGDYTVVTGADGKQYKVFNPGTGNALVQDETFAEKKAAAAQAETSVANDILPKVAITTILGVDSAIQGISNVAAGVVDGIWTAINSVLYTIGSVLNATWVGALIGGPLQIGVAVSYGIQVAVREAWRLADRARRVALYSLIPLAVGPAYTAQLINNYNTNRVANGTKQDNELIAALSNGKVPAITEPKTVNGEADKASAATIADAVFEGTFLGTEAVENAGTGILWGLTNAGITALTYASGITTGVLSAVPIVGTIAQIIGGPLTLAGFIGGSIAYDAENVADDVRRLYNKGMLLGALWSSSAARVADMYGNVIDAANNGDATVYKLA